MSGGRLIAALAVGCVAIAGCGGGGNKAAEDVAKQFAKDAQTADPAICQLLSAQALQKFGSTGCAKRIRQRATFLKDIGEGGLTIEESSGSGSKATVKAKDSDDKLKFKLVKEGGRWKIDDIQ